MPSTSRVTLQPAYLLHSKPYRDTSLLLEAFTRDYGRIGLIARGARRNTRSSLKGVLQPFQPLLLSWSGRGELWTITDAEIATNLPMLKGNSLISGFYLNELMLRLVQRHLAYPELYLSYSHALDELINGEELEWGLRIFERDLLRVLGYGLLLTSTADSGETIQPGLQYCYYPERGPVVEQVYPGDYISISGESLLSLETGQMPKVESLVECKRLMRAVLAIYLGDKPLSSREMFRKQF